MTKLFRTVLVPYDFSRYADRALGLAVELARADRGKVVVLHAIPRLSVVVGVPPGAFPAAAVTSRMATDQEARLRARVQRAVGRGRTPAVTCRVVVADPFSAIAAAARSATVIVMGTLGLTGLPRLLLGSVAEKVVRHAPVPVLTVPARAAAGGRRRRPRRRRRARRS